MARKKPTIKTISLHDIRIDGGTQPRVELDMGHVKDLTAVLDDGGEFKDPIVVFDDGSNLWLADGHHRFQSYTACDIVEVPAEIHVGTQRDAVLYSVGANAHHGLRRSQADKRQSVEKLLSDGEWCKWSDREIARRCSVDHSFVGKLRKEFTGDNTSERTYTDRHGNTTTMNTANIGRREVPPAPADDPGDDLDGIDSYDDLGDEPEADEDWKKQPLRGLVSDGVVDAFAKWWEVEEAQANVGAWMGALRFKGAHEITQKLREHGAMAGQISQAFGKVDLLVKENGGFEKPAEDEQPSALKAAEQEAAVLRRCQADIQQIRSAVKATEGQPIGAFLNHQDIDLHLKNAWAGIKFGLPRHVCPACDGNGKGCKVCRGGGWLPKIHFERYEAAQKEG